MNSNPILEEVWRVKDELAREAGYDLHRMCENLRRWEAENISPDRLVHSAAELRQLAGEEGRKRAEASELSLKEEPPQRE